MQYTSYTQQNKQLKIAIILDVAHFKNVSLVVLNVSFPTVVHYSVGNYKISEFLLFTWAYLLSLLMSH